MNRRTTLSGIAAIGVVALSGCGSSTAASPAPSSPSASASSASASPTPSSGAAQTQFQKTMASVSTSTSVAAVNEVRTALLTNPGNAHMGWFAHDNVYDAQHNVHASVTHMVEVQRTGNRTLLRELSMDTAGQQVDTTQPCRVAVLNDAGRPAKAWSFDCSQRTATNPSALKYKPASTAGMLGYDPVLAIKAANSQMNVRVLDNQSSYDITFDSGANAPEVLVDADGSIERVRANLGQMVDVHDDTYPIIDPEAAR